MQFDRAISFLLEGHTIQRVAWVEPENKRIENVGGKFCFAGHETSFGRQIPYIRRVNILADDISADDWQIVHHYYSGDQVETPSPQPNVRVDFNKLYSHPLAQGFYDLAQQIERLGTSPEMTSVIVAVQSVKSQVEAEINRLLQNAASDGALLTRYHRWCEKNGCAPSTSDLYRDGPTQSPQQRRGR